MCAWSFLAVSLFVSVSLSSLAGSRGHFHRSFGHEHGVPSGDETEDTTTVVTTTPTLHAHVFSEEDRIRSTNSSTSNPAFAFLNFSIQLSPNVSALVTAHINSVLLSSDYREVVHSFPEHGRDATASTSQPRSKSREDLHRCFFHGDVVFSNGARGVAAFSTCGFHNGTNPSRFSSKPNGPADHRGRELRPRADGKRGGLVTIHGSLIDLTSHRHYTVSPPAPSKGPRSPGHPGKDSSGKQSSSSAPWRFAAGHQVVNGDLHRPHHGHGGCGVASHSSSTSSMAGVETAEHVRKRIAPFFAGDTGVLVDQRRNHFTFPDAGISNQPHASAPDVKRQLGDVDPVYVELAIANDASRFAQLGEDTTVQSVAIVNLVAALFLQEARFDKEIHIVLVEQHVRFALLLFF